MNSLQVTNQAYREIFQSTSEGIIMVDQSGRIAIASAVAEQLFGYEKDGLLGLTPENLLPERYRESHVSFRRAFNADSHRRKVGVRRDLAALRRDGTEFPVEVSLSYTQVKGEILLISFDRQHAKGSTFTITIPQNNHEKENLADGR